MTRAPRTAGTLLATLLTTLLAVTWAAPARATTVADYQRDIFSATNHQRDRHDLRKFRHQPCVQKYAVRQAKRMAQQERMFHQDLGVVLRRCHLHKAGENVAFGFDLGIAVVDIGWMQSPPHRANILDPAFRLLGSGARRGDNGVWYAAQVFGRR
jgi:uncharacterized protein YkwD